MIQLKNDNSWLGYWKFRIDPAPCLILWRHAVVHPLPNNTKTSIYYPSCAAKKKEKKSAMPPKPPKTRYFKGKAPTALSESESDSEAEEEVDIKPTYKQRQKQRLEDERNFVAGGAGRVITDVKEIVREGAKAKMGGGMKMDLGNVQVGRKVGDGGVKGMFSGEI